MDKQTQEALKMAIEAFYAFMDEKITDEDFKFMQWKACQACKEALEQPAQEPMAWINEDELPDEYPYDEMFKYSEIVYGVRVFPVYPPNHQWQGLTDDEIQEYLGDDLVSLHGYSFVQGVRWASKQLKEKNHG